MKSQAQRLYDEEWHTKVCRLTRIERKILDDWRRDLWDPFEPDTLDDDSVNMAVGIVMENEKEKAYGER